MINKENLNEEQLQKLADIEQKGYLDRIPEDEEGAIRYINNWHILQNSKQDEVVDEPIEDTTPTIKKTRKRLTFKEKREKLIAKINKVEEDLEQLKLELKTLEDQEVINNLNKLNQEGKIEIIEFMESKIK